MQHAPDCTGGHLSSLSCAEVKRLRAEAEANVWLCKGATRSGYHRFGHPNPAPWDQCLYEGCTRTWGELQT